MLENIRLAFQGVWSHKLRSMLTMLGIIIGIASIISIVSTIQGTNEQIKQNLIGGGNNTVDIELYRADEKIQVSDYEQAPSGVPTITDDILQEIKDVDGVESAAAYYSRSYADSIYYNNNSLQGAQVLGVDNNYFSTTGYVVRTGRTFREEDYKEFHKVVILDQSAATSLFQEESPLGKTIEINKEPFTVIGIAQKLEEFEPTINSFEEYNNYKGNESLGVVYIPSACWCIPYQYDEPQNVVVRASSTETMTKVGQKSADILNGYMNVKEDDVKYKATDVLELAAQIQSSSATMNTQLIWIASISLLVGGIGIMNIMLVSVTERTREIGIRMAIGARKRDIIGQFLVEAAVVSCCGGIIGIVLGCFASAVLGRFMLARQLQQNMYLPNVEQFTVLPSVGLVLGAFLFSALLGIIFGLYPANKASNLQPVDALRTQ